MRSKIILFVLSLSAVVALGLFQPALTYAGQAAPSQFTLAAAAAESAPTSVILTARDHGGGWRGGRALHGGGGWHAGGPYRHFYGGRSYVQPYYAEPYYVEPSCDSVWDPYLNQRVCVSDDDDLD